MILPDVKEQSDEWKDLRAKNVGASEVAILFGHQSFESHFSLWNKKAGKITDEYEDNVNTLAGKHMEAWIAEQVALKQGWKVEKFTGYAVHDEIEGIGGTPDYTIHYEDGKKGVLEIKNVGQNKYYEEWVNGKPQFAHQLQVMHQLSCLKNDGYSRAAIGAWLCGDRISVTEYDLRPKTVKIIESKVREFWLSVSKDVPPCPDAHRTTRDALDKINAMQEKPTHDFLHCDETRILVDDYEEAEFIHKNQEERFKELQNQMRDKFKISKNMNSGYTCYVDGGNVVNVWKNGRIVITKNKDYGV